MRRENKELKTDAPSGHGLAAALGAFYCRDPKPNGIFEMILTTYRVFGALLLFLLVAIYMPEQVASAALAEEKSVRKSGFVTANGVKLHYLDWGGRGETLLLLAGFGDTAEVFDDFATKFTDRFHVLGLTRRGFGESEKPKDGYDVPTRVEDIHHFLEALKIDRASIVGHSMAGDEMTLFATLYPQCVKKLVYLDAAHDRTPQAYREYLHDPVFIENTTDRGMRSRRMFLEVLDLPGAAEVPVKDMPPAEEWEVLVATQRATIRFHADYTRVQAPALAFYTTSTNAHYPSTWLPKDADESLRVRADQWWKEKGNRFSRSSAERFRKEMPHGRVVKLNDADHYIFRGKTGDDVVRQTYDFLVK
jgi:pimeloyl-ACP methyl ester carboxylesterase